MGLQILNSGVDRILYGNQMLAVQVGAIAGNASNANNLNYVIIGLVVIIVILIVITLVGNKK